MNGVRGPKAIMWLGVCQLCGHLKESERWGEILALPQYSLSTNASLVIPQTQVKVYFSAGGFKRFAGIR